MNEGRIATRYAKALLISLGEEAERGLACYRATERILPLLEGSAEEISSLLSNVLLSMQRKEDAIGAIFAKLAPELENYARLMVRNGRGGYLLLSLRVFLELYRKAHGIVRADIITAIPLPAEEQQRLTAYLKQEYGTSLEVGHRENAELIGGFQLLVGDSLLDRSVQGELRAIAAELER